MSESKTSPAGSLVIALLALTGLTVIGFFVAKTWLPHVASAHGQGIDNVTLYLMVATGLIFVAGHTILVWFVWRFSRSDAPHYRPISARLEWKWALLPVIVMCVIAEGGVVVVGMPAWAAVYAEDPPHPLQLEVVGKQFEWFTRYPGKDGTFGKTIPEKVDDVSNPLGLDEADPAAKDDVILRGTLRLPRDRAIRIRLRTQDVIHSFTVPQFRVKQDLIPGFVSRVQFRAVETGTYELACAELCGLGHFRMRAVVSVTTEAEFEQWLAQQHGWFE
ncbi:MAG: cytochrome c oxidase subunit II transmembrane domain-containing protein [Planctomycetota bacterium]